MGKCELIQGADVAGNAEQSVRQLPGDNVFSSSMCGLFKMPAYETLVGNFQSYEKTHLKINL